MTETIRITKPVPGTYQYGVFNWSGQNRDLTTADDWTAPSQVQIYDNSVATSLTISSSSGYPYPSGEGNWWSVVSFNPLGGLAVANTLQATAPNTSATTAGTGTGKSGIIVGTFWSDFNFNNVFDLGNDLPYAGETVQLVIDGDGFPWGPDDTVVQTTRTDAAGRCVFVQVPLGTYLVDSGWTGSIDPPFLTVTMNLTGRVVLPGKGLNWGT